MKITLLLSTLLLIAVKALTQQNDGLKPLRLVHYPDSSLADLWMDETPVTYTDFEIYVRAGGMKNAYWYYDSYHKPDQPVTGISWHHAVDYCNWRSASIKGRLSISPTVPPNSVIIISNSLV